jgi:hypothetical protein
MLEYTYLHLMSREKQIGVQHKADFMVHVRFHLEKEYLNSL